MEEIQAVTPTRGSMSFVANLRDKLKERFPGGLKTKAPFNVLTFLDPSHIDLYAYEADVFKMIKDDILRDPVYVPLLVTEQSTELPILVAAEPAPVAAPSTLTDRR